MSLSTECATAFLSLRYPSLLINPARTKRADPGRKIAPNTGANATKFFALATKSLKLVTNLATRISNHSLIPRDLAIDEDLLR